MTIGLDFSRTDDPASKDEVEKAAEEIWAILKEFSSPQDAALALAVSHTALLYAAFPPGHPNELNEAMEAHGSYVIAGVNNLHKARQ